MHGDHSHLHLNNQQFKDIMCIIGSCLFITTDTDLLQTNKMTSSQLFSLLLIGVHCCDDDHYNLHHISCTKACEVEWNLKKSFLWLSHDLKLLTKETSWRGIHSIFQKITDQNWFFLSRTIGILIIEKSQHMHFTFLQFFLLLWQAKEPWETTPEEKMSLAKHHKDKGTDCFKVAFHFPAHFVNVDTPRFLQCSLSSFPDCREVLLKSKSH